MDTTFWQGKRVFLTGHTGFKGSWLSLWLQSVGVELWGYALEPPTSPSLFEVARVADGMTSTIGDICDLQHLKQAIADCRPEIAIHMAAQSVVKSSYVDPVLTYNTNVMGTVNLFEAIRQVGGVRAVLNITSDKCYENREWVWGYRENDPLGGYDPYSSSKACAELVTTAYRNSFFNPSDYATHGVAIASARAGNVIGGGDWTPDGLVSDLVKSLLAEKPVVLRNPMATRPWQHVLDALNGYLTLAEHLYDKGPAFADAWNFGPYESDVQPVSWLVDRLLAQWGANSTWEQDRAHHPHEANALSLDCSKARLKLGWKPQLSLEAALAQIIDWTKSYQAGEDMQQVTRAAIEQFMNLSS
ncbi:CDP-glucose 4,6-dehydratase [Chamaesiphon polymorphus]|uniref:CDP-glucose 4,6-dehydratase n=1 Tax=Chamaesiphon polymorphus CCALA 037 TaxID=2107692 RepID=A0A2T1FVE9_9CYAN|nr:CDP-glucose 4,6-dehydratase [Chamaesiphon polymorphus]PSB48975.1 CDP-glucose 4,6-dehydratase [Chamaesiphon polymorphus CCALA 037]